MEQPPSSSFTQKNKNTASTPLIQAKLPSYLAEAFGDVYQEDGLVVLGRGMGILSLMAAFIRFYSDTEDGYASLREHDEYESIECKNEKGASRAPLVFVIGLKEKERSSVIETLESWGTPHELLPTQITNESGQGRERQMLYRQGGVFLITSRILIVDLLTRIANPNQIAGESSNI